MNTRRVTLDDLTEILCTRSRYVRTHSLQNGVAAVIEALIDAAPSKDELEKIYREYGLEGVRDYILGAEKLLPASVPACAALQLELNRLAVKYDTLLKQYEALVDTNSKDLETLRSLQKDQYRKFHVKNMLEAVSSEAHKAAISLDIIKTNMNEINKYVRQEDTNNPS